MAGVNGVEIKVGQVWRTRGGGEATVEAIDDHPDFPVSCDCGTCGKNGRYWGDIDAESTKDDEEDLIELIHDENGFTIWRGGEQPPETVGRFVTFATNEFEGWTREADLLHWAHNGSRGDIVAYKVVEQAADSATLAEETLSALGWTFDGQAWVDTSAINLPIPLPVEFPVEQPTAELPVGMLDNPVSAPALLTAAAKHMNDRAATYDKPEGERSMAQTVAVFEAYHGIKLTEAQGWHFMQVLKDVRLFTRETYHGDSAEDCIAYAALKAEAKAQEGGV